MSRKCYIVFCLMLACSFRVGIAAITNEQVVDHVERSLWIDSKRTDLTNSQALTEIFLQPVKRLIIPCFVDGQTLFPSKSKLFHQMDLYQGKADVLPSLIEQSHLQGKQIYAFVDCLHWVETSASASQDIFAKYPELAERDIDGDYGDPLNGKYASPFNPQVRQALRDLIEEIGTRYPQLDGLVLQCRLPRGAPLLGYSEATCEASKQAIKINPLDVNLGGGVEETTIALDWFDWRFAEVTQLVQELSETFKAKNRHGKVAAVGYAKWHRLTIGRRNSILEDWPRWAGTGTINELILESSWDESMQGAYADAMAQLAEVNQPVKATMLLNLQDIKTKPNLMTALQIVRGQEPNSLMLQAAASGDLSRALQLWSILPYSPA